MKKVGFGVFLVLLVLLLAFCASNGLYKPLSPEQLNKKIGSIDIEFISSHQRLNDKVRHQAYIDLKKEAQNKFQGNIDVGNISVVWIEYITNVIPYNVKYSATGDVFLIGEGNMASTRTGIEGALARAANDALKNVPPRSKIAIVYITSEDKSSTDYISGELEFIWVNAGYIIIDRSELNRIRREQNFQMSGEVDDNTAVSIGKFSGADIIVTGRVDGEGHLRRLRLRALSTQNAQVIGVASEPL